MIACKSGPAMEDFSVQRQSLRLYSSILFKHGFSLSASTRILDFGCGRGKTVRAFRHFGLDAFGCDIELEAQNEFIQVIDGETQTIPFPDCCFDLVFSEQVFEHVQDHSRAVSEIHRVLKPGGLSLHVFPSKLRPIEPHVFVPLAGVIRSYPWLLFWAFLGIRNTFQAGKNFKEVAQLNWKYLRKGTCYLSGRELRRIIGAKFHKCEFCELEFIRHSQGGSRRLRPISAFFPSVASLYSTFWMRVVVLGK